MSLRSKPFEMVDEPKDCFAPDAGGSAVVCLCRCAPNRLRIWRDQKIIWRLMQPARRVVGLAAWVTETKCRFAPNRLRWFDEPKDCFAPDAGGKGKGGCFNRRPVKKFLCVGKSNVAPNGAAAELRAYMRGGMS
jgi:hypothetical protein